MEKKRRKSVPRPNSGRRGSDGAIGLVPLGVRVTPDDKAKVVRNGGSPWVRKLIREANEG